MKRLGLTILLGFASGFGFGLTPDDAFADQLITSAEAALPALPDSGLTMRGITRGPAIEQVEPEPAGKSVTSPLSLKIKFTARNNAEIDKDSVKVTYVKSPSVDLTARVKSHLTPDGIEMKQADVPPGTHVIRIDLKDTQGRASTAIIKLSVTGK
jgi:hypothetical protein